MYLRIKKYTIFNMKIISTYFLHPCPQNLLQDKNVVNAETIGKQIFWVTKTTGDTA